MRAKTIGLAVLLSAVLHVSSARADQNAPAARPATATPIEDARTESGPTITSSAAFNIPFTLDPNQPRPVEVRLFVSADKGAHWRPYAIARPDEGSFFFRAANDGEYWFAVRTLDRNSRLLPNTPLRPEVVVVVDTRRPQLEFTAEAGSAGEVKTSWRAFDEHLQAESLIVDFQPRASRAASASSWRPIKVELPQDGVPRTSISGANQWWPETAAHAITVRAQIRDRAGNVTVEQRQVALPQVATARPNNPAAAAFPADPFLRRRPAADAATNTPWQPDNTPTAAPHTANDIGGQVADGAPKRANPGEDTAPPSGGLADLDRLRPSPSPVEPPVGNRVSASRDESATAARNLLPAGQRPRLTNSRHLNLDYDIEAVDPSGVAKVELWFTRDGGQTWTKGGEDEDKQSPFTIEATEEGVYGFRIVIASNGGLSSDPPQPGDAADIWIGVDVTPPIAEIISVPFGVKDRAGQLAINWRAQDEHLAARPIKLEYSDQPNGPWTTIAADLPNTGQYHWQVNADVPEKIYLQLEVRDDAGNVQTDRIDRAIDLSGLRPKARIRGFQPIENAAGHEASLKGQPR